MTTKKIFLYVLAAFGICQLAIVACGIIVLLSRYIGGSFCNWLSPTNQGFNLPVIMDQVIQMTTVWSICIRNNFQFLVIRVIPDAYNVSSLIVATAVLEEIQYRGPLLLLKKYPAYIWWSVALLLNVWFLLCHDTAPIFLVCIFVMATLCAWLVRKTGKLWPAIILHMVCDAYWMFGFVMIKSG